MDSESFEIPPIGELLPSAQDLLNVQETFSEDFSEVNDLLEKQGQPPLEFGPPKVKSKSISNWDMDQMMLRMIFSLQRQVLNLESELQALREDD
ncbi:hypothetical protein [Poseidonocella sp. HB161398]|uniref:hypothetical protein n=1 Tax=Poseidonocella sp. HB161398 TaxID=2320855 RepID=UPI00110947E8|nr:hypothetical protein [Poseidonocella sp. HB161398]